MIKNKLKSIFMMLIMLVNIIGEGAVFAAQNKRGGNKKIIDNGIYVIESLVGEGKVLDICGAEKIDGAKLHIWDESKNSLNQVFYIDKNEDGSYAIMACHSGMFLGVKDQERNVKQYNPSFKENYKWEIVLKNNGEYELKLKSNKLYWTITPSVPLEYKKWSLLWKKIAMIEPVWGALNIFSVSLE